MMRACFMAVFLASDMTFSGHAEKPPTNEQLEPLFRAFVFTSRPDLDTNTVFNIRKWEVKGLWEGLKVAVFEVQDSLNGYVFDGYVFAYHDGQIIRLANSNGAPGLFSGLVSNGAFYYTYGFGSGIFRSHVAKMQIADGRLEVSISGGFRDEVLFVTTDSGGKVKVVDGGFKPFNFNDWGAARGVGFAGMTNSSGLQIIDAKGNIIAPTWGPGTNEVIFEN